MEDKNIRPPYTSYRSFANLVAELRAHEVLPDVIDRSFLSKRSGSEQSALIATLRWFGLIDDSNVPTETLQEYLTANEQEAPALLRKMVISAYSFMTDESINVRSATTSQMTERFRQLDISGSTLTKSIAFFLAAAKEAGIQISPHVKAPTATNGGAIKKKGLRALPTTPLSSNNIIPSPPSEEHKGREAPKSLPGMITIPIPIFGMKDGAIYLPDSMDERQWTSVIKMTEFILKNYRETMGSPTDLEDKSK